MRGGSRLNPALDLVLEPLGLATTERDGALFVSNMDDVMSHMVTKVYDVTDLLGAAQAPANLVRSSR